MSVFAAADVPASSATGAGTCRAASYLAAATQMGDLRFNERAFQYAQHACVQRDMAAWLAQWLPQAAADWSPALGQGNSAVLDLGAGEGMFTRYLAQRFPQVMAVDAAEQMVLAGRRGLPAVDWRHGDAWSLTDGASATPLVGDSARIGALVSSSLLQWCAQPQQTIAAWASHCPRGTRLLHGFYTEPTLTEWRQVFGELSPICWRTAQQWSALFAGSGWRVLRQEFCQQRYVFADALTLARSLHGTGATVAGASALTVGQYRRLLQTYTQAFAAPAEQSVERQQSAPCASGIAQPSTAACVQPAQSASAAADAVATSASVRSVGKPVYATWGFFRIEAVRE